MQKSVKSVEIGRAHVARDFEVGYDSNPPSGRFNLFLGSGAPSAQRFWLHELSNKESFSFVNPTTFTTLRFQQRKPFFCQSNHLHHSSSPTMPLRLLFPLAYPLPPLLRLLPTPASARFYSPSRLATSFITPTSRRPINRHRLLSRKYIPNQASHTKPTIEEIKKLDEDELLGWIQEKLPKLLKDDDLKKLQGERVDGVVFLNHAGDKKYFREECNLAIGTSERLANLAREIAGGVTAGSKSTDHAMQVTRTSIVPGG